MSHLEIYWRLNLFTSEPMHAEGCPKALGIHWNTTDDVFFVAVPPSLRIDVPTKTEVASHVPQLFDLMGWFSPVTLIGKYLQQQIWKSGILWDDFIPQALLSIWNQWNKELFTISEFSIRHKMSPKPTEVLDTQLHGFCDASKKAYGSVVYGRLLHNDSKVTIALLMSKTRVAPLTEQTIPRLELCGVKQLSALITFIANPLDIHKAKLFAWCDSTAALGRLRNPP